MAKQYEIRTKDLSKVILIPTSELVEHDPVGYFNFRFSMSKDRVLVLHEFETPAEADKARLDFMQSNPEVSMQTLVDELGIRYWFYGNCDYNYGTLQQAIDSARQAPQPSVKIIATPEGSV